MVAIQLIDEAVDHGARLSKACECLGIAERTYYRWQSLDRKHQSYEDRRAYADHSDPVNKLTPEERQRVIDTVNEERFASKPPCEIVPALADEGEYIAMHPVTSSDDYKYIEVFRSYDIGTTGST